MRLQWNAPEIPNQLLADFQWGDANVDYADSVHNGEISLGGIKSVARPWTDVAIAETNCPAVFAANYRGDVREAFQGFVDRMKDKFDDVIDTHDFGMGGANEKQFRPSVPTWSSISDSGALRDSLQIEVRES